MSNHSNELDAFETPPRSRITLKKVSGILLAAVPLLMPMTVKAADDTRPNIIMFVADDAGYSDFAGFGGEGKTPAMDSLAGVGKTFTNFHSMPNCSPSRSTFLTGIDNHMNGLGTMSGQLKRGPSNPQRNTPGYKGYVNKQSIMISTLLKDSGYHTYMVGKWHLGQDGEEDGQTVFFRGLWPIDRGYEQSFGFLNGDADHFGACERFQGDCTRFIENDEILIPSFDFATDYFSAAAHTEKAIEYIDADKAVDAERKPFFLYYADTMPHSPNQLPAEFIKQEYIDMYLQKGWDGIRSERFERMKDLGILPEAMALPERYEGYPAWDDETDPNWDVLLSRVADAPHDKTWGGIKTVAELKMTLAKKMAVYTGMLEFFDTQVADIVDHLKSINEYDNTVFFYFSDNGGDSREWDYEDQDNMLHKGINNSFDNLGLQGSYISNGKQWAQAVNVPFYSAKATNAEGGIRSAMVVSFPGGDIETDVTTGKFVNDADLAATVLDYAGVAHPVGVGVKPDWNNCTGSYGEETGVCPMNGKSMRPLLNGDATAIHDLEPIGYEIFGRVLRQAGAIVGDRPNKALFLEDGDVQWKILRLGDAGWGAGPNEPWRLYNLTEDPAESNDLTAEMPQRMATMMAMYNDYEQSVGVIPQSAQKVTEVQPGSHIPQQFTVSNTGDEAETYTLSCQSNWPCAINSESSFTLAAGESTDVELTISVPSNAGKQTRTAQVVVTRENVPQMSNNQIFVVQVAEALSATADYVRVMNWAEDAFPELFPIDNRQELIGNELEMRFYSATQSSLVYDPSITGYYMHNQDLFGDGFTFVGFVSDYIDDAKEAGY